MGLFSQGEYVEKERYVYTDKTKNKYMRRTLLGPRGEKGSYCDNFVSTSKYHWWNFLPKNLWFQFQRVSNCYFLFNMVIALVPGVSPIHPITAILPLLFVLSVAAIKDGYEDLQRHKDDNKWNSAPGKKDHSGGPLSGVVRNGVVDDKVPSADVEVGDIVKMVRGEVVRADTLLLSSSDDKEHTCFIETMQLDGETNAKQRQAQQTTVGTATMNLTADLINPVAFQAVQSGQTPLELQCVGPGPDLHDWTGKLTYGDKSEGVSISQFLYRGCVIANTSWVYGLTIYTGVDTKMQRNNKPKQKKKSNLDGKLNIMIIVVMVIQHIVIFVLCGLAVMFRNDNMPRDGDVQSWYISWYLAKVSDVRSIDQSPGNEGTGPKLILVRFDTDVAFFFWQYMTYFILMSFMIPISLFVTIELTKLVQKMFMDFDLKMQSWLRDANNKVVGDGAVGCDARTSELNEQLAIVKYIFSDKTGTLTENRMQFHTGEVGNPEQTDPRTCGRNFADAPPEERGVKTEGDIALYLREKQSDGRAIPPRPTGDGSRSRAHVENVIWYLMNLSMCHELSLLQDEDESAPPSDVRQYQGASPDEVALAKCAQWNGVEFSARSSGSITIAILGQLFDFLIIDTLPFTSKRKMMSIVLRGPCRREPGGELAPGEHTQLFCLTKGADTVIIENAAGGMKIDRGAASPVEGRAPDPWYRDNYHQRLWGELDKMAGIGLRTLCLAYKPLHREKEFAGWHTRYAEAKKVVDPGARESQMEECWAEMERDFYVCGATAIEDKLQDRVPETVDFLLRAGVVVWMLTGDKQETAETIAGTASLIDKATWDVLYLNSQVPVKYTDDVALDPAARSARMRARSAWLCGLAGTPQQEPVEAYEEGRKISSSDLFIPQATRRANQCKEQRRKCAVVTDGGTLGVICPPGPVGEMTAPATAAVEAMWSSFTDLAQKVNSGILCRLTPEQKGKIVRVFQQTTGETALAIGDGANDVPMINESFVGIGIMGLEGSQAVLASDYAIPRFKHLKRLLFVHGRYALYRNSMCVLFSFYKNFALAFIQVFFAFFCGFSGQTLFDSWLLAMQNFMFTSIPPLFVGMFEKDVDEDICELKPAMYMPLREGLYFDKKHLVMWFGEALLHATLIFWLTHQTMTNDDIGGDSGRTGDVLMVGALTLTCQICTVLLKLALHIRHWDAIQFFGISVSIVLFILFLVTYCSLPVASHINIGYETVFYQTGIYILEDPKFWLWSFFFIIGVVMTIDMPVMYIQRQYFPTLRDLGQRRAMQLRAARVEAKLREKSNAY